MDQTEIINKIIEFADNAHGAQMRKYGDERYIVHPIRVMEICSAVTQDLPVLAAAVLHDVIEDTPYSEQDIMSFLKALMPFQDRAMTLQIVKELTDVYVKKEFPALNRSARKKRELERLREISPEAQTIKYADIIDNSREISGADPDFALRYLQECYDIVSELKDGEPKLRSLAQKAIRKAYNNLAGISKTGL
ncbi:GTP pyrophosphokinase [compost metagenome]